MSLAFRAALTRDLRDSVSGLVGVFARGSVATYIDRAGRLRVAGDNEPRFEARGLLLEGSRTNYALHSSSPASQTVELPETGAYTLTAWGGSCEIAAGTATGTGFGIATDGAPVTITVTEAGTVELTVESADRIQLEQGSFTSSFIPTEGAAVTRAADRLSFQGGGDLIWPDGDVSCYVEYTPLASGAAVDDTAPIIALRPSEGGFGVVYLSTSGLRVTDDNSGISATRPAAQAGLRERFGARFGGETKQAAAGEVISAAQAYDGDFLRTGNFLHVGSPGADYGADTRSAWGHLRNLHVWHSDIGADALLYYTQNGPPADGDLGLLRRRRR